LTARAMMASHGGQGSIAEFSE